MTNYNEESITASKKNMIANVNWIMTHGDAMNNWKSAEIISLAGNVGVVSGIFSPQNDRHADMSALCRRHDTDHVGDIA